MLFLVLAVLLLWLTVAFRRWLFVNPHIHVLESTISPAMNDKIVELLIEQGYKAIHGKKKINIRIHLDNQQLGSHVFVDFFARKANEVYLVKVAKPRKQLNINAGSAIREALLPYALIYKEIAGVLYVDPLLRKVYKIQFELEL